MRRREPYICYSSVNGPWGVYVGLDAANCEVTSLSRYGKGGEEPIYRQLTRKERRVAISLLFEAGQRSMPYLFWRALILWLTPSLKPLHGSPSTSGS